MQPELISSTFLLIGLYCQYLIFSSYVEIYCEHIRDLLTRKPPIPNLFWLTDNLIIAEKDNLTILEDKNKGLWITDATEVPVTNMKEVLSVMNTYDNYFIIFVTSYVFLPSLIMFGKTVVWKIGFLLKQVIFGLHVC